MKCRKPAVLFLLCSLAWISTAAARAEGLGVNLLRPDSLAGWQYGDPPAAGWTVKDGRLSGAPGATALLSGWTVGDFDLRFDWSAAGQLTLLLPDVPTGRGLAITLCEGAGCGAVRDGDRTLAPGASVEARPGRTHTAAVQRAAGKLAILIDGRRVTALALAPQRRFGLGWALSAGPATVAGLRLQEPLGQSMFNGRDLEGWWTPGDKNSWAVKEGTIARVKSGGSYLRSEKLYANFTFSCDYKIKAGGNSGVGIRTPRLGWPSGDGMEIQIWDIPYKVPFDKHQALAIYGNVPPLARHDKTGQWNHVTIKADGRMISAWMNGELCQQYNTAEHPELKWRHLQGWIGLQDHNDDLQFRNLYVHCAPAGLGLDAWYAPQAPSPLATVVARVLNTQQLAVADQVCSRTVVKRFDLPAPGEQVLAELIGPGALVRLARNFDEGTLAFFFDGETRPRVECKVRDLSAALPTIGEDSRPLLCCLAYQKSLRIVARDVKPALHKPAAAPPAADAKKPAAQKKAGKEKEKDSQKTPKKAGKKAGDGKPNKPAAKTEIPKFAEYRLDYLSFPPNSPVESYRAGQNGLPRGWLDCANYRFHQHGGGTIREYDPLPRYTSGKQTLEPGQSRSLVQVSGAGIVQWLKLDAAKLPLEQCDLWLEATIDGETRPALSAPARFWFPALVEPRNFNNFVMLDRGGPLLRLAMPFVNGFRLSARNAGAKPIAGMGATLSVLPLAAAEVADRMRLRGIFQPAAAQSNELVRLSGAGRWVGLVYDQPAGDRSVVRTLEIDGQPQSGWQDTSFDSLLGYVGDNGRQALSGRKGSLWWHYLLAAPIDFHGGLVLKTSAAPLGDRLVLYYGAAPR